MNLKASEYRLESRETRNGWQVTLRSGDGAAHAVLEPLALQVGGELIRGTWGRVSQSGEELRAGGQLDHAAGQVTFTMTARHTKLDGPIGLHWQVEFAGGPCTGAITHRITLPGVDGGPDALDLPSLHYGVNTYGSGLFPHPDPRRGFSFRADRLAQPLILLSDVEATWSYFAENEAPVPPEPELVYSLGMGPLDGGAQGDTGFQMFFRYPQHEYGHGGRDGAEAYVAKNTFRPGEMESATWQEGDSLQKTLYLWPRPPGAAHDYSAPARFLWRQAYTGEAAPAVTSLWQQIGERIRWFNTRLYNPSVGGGQYESPEGSGIAMLGFVEQSLCMASVTLSYTLLARTGLAPAISADDLDKWQSHATGALLRWATEGRSEEGLLYPVCGLAGYRFGYRDYGDYENLSIVNDEGFDTIRLATEARGLLSAAGSAKLLGTFNEEVPRAWEEAALGVADWLMSHPLPGGGYSARYSRAGMALDDYPGGTGAAVSLLCDCARLMNNQARREGYSYLQEAIAAYEGALAGLVRSGRFAGGTLDASTPDREAAIAALEACLGLYERTGSEQYLKDARMAADNILSYTFVYPISTFGPDTDAAKLGLSTFGATVVSPENQHLDPVPTGPGLIAFGLYADDEVCVQAGIESLRWCLDGRWGIPEREGMKQSEQLLHTRWYYNTFFSQRGDFRRGMPLWGRDDSEHGWPQVIPALALLGSGQVMLDWHSGRAAAIDGWRMLESGKERDGTVRMQLAPTTQEAEPEHGLYLRVLRVPPTDHLTLSINGREQTVSSNHLEHGIVLSLHESEARLEISLPRE